MENIAPGWFGYYTRKRALHQWMQVELLGETDARSVLEIGPAMGAVTALLENAGYLVTTLDMTERQFSFPDVPHIRKNIIDCDAHDLRGFDTILCCEMLEHVEFSTAVSMLKKYFESGARYLIISVPYMEFQVTLDIYLNRHMAREYFSMKKMLSRREFAPEPDFGHQWEIGYKNYPHQRWEEKITESGWKILKRDFTAHCRSVFHLLSR